MKTTTKDSQDVTRS